MDCTGGVTCYNGVMEYWDKSLGSPVTCHPGRHCKTKSIEFFSPLYMGGQVSYQGGNFKTCSVKEESIENPRKNCRVIKRRYPDFVTRVTECFCNEDYCNLNNTCECDERPDRNVEEGY